jgi:hypothetical protein
MDQLAARLERGERAERLLDQLLGWAVANRQAGDSDVRFVTCHSYHGNAFPAVLIDALKFMGEPVGGLKRAKED